jgi:hypothetical protein
MIHSSLQTKGTDITGPSANYKCSIHHWAEHGIAGRGILLDYRGYAHKKGINYDPYDYYPISWEELYQCGKDQGVDIRPTAQGGDIKIGDMLFIRSGWKEAYDNKTGEARSTAALRHGTGKDGDDGQRYAGVSQEQKILDWLHDCYFSSVAGDAPAFEAWPTHEGMRAYISQVEADTRQTTTSTSTSWLSGVCHLVRCWTWRSSRRLVERRIGGSSSSPRPPQTAQVRFQVQRLAICIIC